MAYVGDLQNGRTLNNFKNPLSDPNNPTYMKNAGDTLWGIDIYAWASNHEMKHHDDYEDWWDANGVDPNTDPDTDRVPNEHTLGSSIDYERDFSEEEGGPFDPCDPTTHGSLPGGGTELDDQLVCIFTQDDWDVQSAIDEDWAYPGSRWH